MVLLLKKYGFIRLETDELAYIINDTFEDWRNNKFHSFENRCVYDIKYTKMENTEEFVLSIFIGCTKTKFQF